MRQSFVLVMLVISTIGCGSGDGDDIGGGDGMGTAGDSGWDGHGGDGSDDGGTSGDESIAQLCVDTINMYRATLDLPPYERWEQAESCSNDEAKADSMTGEPHGAFGQCGERAQNECPGWPGPPEAMIEDCLELMWAEGPGEDFEEHGHYLNMSSTEYTKVACGFYTTDDGSVWSVQNFK